jgi:hypothetical protein
MPGTKLGLRSLATGLVAANAVVIAVVIASLFVARRAWDRREDALAALAQARAAAGVDPARRRPLEATLHAPARRLRASTVDRLLLFGILGAAGSGYFTWLLIKRARSPAGVGRARGR